MAAYMNRGAATAPYYRASPYVPPPRPVADVRDDYERWYTETVPNNRMSLSLRSGIHTEIGWALDRLCRLCHNEQFLFKSIPGLIDGLFDWPEWYVTQGYKKATDEHVLFSVPLEEARQRRFALESLFVLRNAALHEQNAWELSRHAHTLPLIMNTLHNLDPFRDENVEVVLHVVDIFQVIASTYVVPVSISPKSNPIPPLIRIVAESPNRTLIIAAFASLTALLSNTANTPHLSADSKAVDAAIKYLPLFIDPSLVDACLNYLYAHVSHPPMARAFLLRPDMSNVLRVLVSLLLHEQRHLEEKVSLDITGPAHTVPAATMVTKDHELTKEELEELLPKPEPHRCYEWMKLMFVAKEDGELTQVDFWNLYKDVFLPFQSEHPLLVASDVIKNVNSVFPQAQAMVLQGPPLRFVVRGVDRKKDLIASERFKCKWDHSQCSVLAFSSPSELFDHILGHVNAADRTEYPCMWSSCSQGPISKQRLRLHILTHISLSQPAEMHSSQSDVITLPSPDSVYPTAAPTKRTPPPPPSTKITYDKPTRDPPSTSLTALLIIRILFRTSFASAEAAPRVDADHFGFPGVIDDTGDQDNADIDEVGDAWKEKEGERRGRKAFDSTRKLLEGVRIRDDVLMGWVTEMVDSRGAID